VDLLPLLLVLAAAGFHAAWNLTLHAAGDRIASMAIASLVGGLLLAPWLVTAPPWEAWPYLLPSIGAQVVYAWALSAAYERGALSFAYPVGRGTSPLLVTLGGWGLLAQTPTASGLTGAAALACGLVLLARRAHQREQTTAIGFALVTGCAIATYSVLDAGAVAHVEPAGYLAAVQLGSGAVLLARLGGGVARLRDGLAVGARIGVGQTVAYLLVLFAFQRAAAGSVSTLREIAVLIAILASRERPGAVVWLGAGLCVAGAVLAAA
jgi:drug/metabolite transporter (DMT)-like permease